jgi:hypothetical protein
VQLRLLPAQSVQHLTCTDSWKVRFSPAACENEIPHRNCPLGQSRFVTRAAFATKLEAFCAPQTFVFTLTSPLTTAFPLGSTLIDGVTPAQPLAAEPSEYSSMFPPFVTRRR